MTYARLPLLLLLCRWLVAGCLLVAGIMMLVLAYEAVAVSDQREVRLALDTTKPALFGFWDSMQRGFEEGAAGPHQAPQALPEPRLAAGMVFELRADHHAPLLYYREPSTLRRLALLALGAWSGGLSVANLLLLGLGSWLLLRLLHDVTPAVPFTQANAHRLLWLAGLVLGLNIWEYVARVAVLALVPAFRVAELTAPLNQYVRLNTDELVPGFLTGFILLIIAAVYQRGVVLSREAELVI